MLVAVTERHLLPVLAKYPELQGVLIDLPEVVSNTLVLETSKFGDRCRAIGGDVLDSVAVSGDIFIIKRVMMGFSDEKVDKILAQLSCYYGPSQQGTRDRPYAA